MKMFRRLAYSCNSTCSCLKPIAKYILVNRPAEAIDTSMHSMLRNVQAEPEIGRVNPFVVIVSINIDDAVGYT